MIESLEAKDKELQKLYENGASLGSYTVLKTGPFDPTKFLSDEKGMVENDLEFLTTDGFYQLTEQTFRAWNAPKVVTISAAADERDISKSKSSSIENSSNTASVSSRGTNRFYVSKRKIDETTKSKVSRKLQKL